MTGLVDRLERASWVERARHDLDRRQVVVQLAAARRDAIDAGRALRERLLGDALAELDDTALAEAAALLDETAGQLAAGAAELARDRAVASDGEGAGDAGDQAPIGAIKHGRLRFATGAAHLQLRGARIKDLYRATFSGKRPLVTVDPGGEVSIQYKGFSLFGQRVAAYVAEAARHRYAARVRWGEPAHDQPPARDRGAGGRAWRRQQPGVRRPATGRGRRRDAAGHSGLGRRDRPLGSRGHRRRQRARGDGGLARHRLRSECTRGICLAVHRSPHR